MKTRKLVATLGMLAIGLAMLSAVPSASAWDVVQAGGGGSSGDNCNGTVEIDGCQYPDQHTGEVEDCSVWAFGSCEVGH